jgi:aryl-alcohol dehydrogenase (NADP+)
MRTLDDIVRSGKVRYIGASSMYAWQFGRMLSIAEKNGWTRFVSMQNHLNLIYREEEREMMPLCRAEGIGMIPYSPMARGFLAGDRQRQGGGETTRARSDKLAAKFYFAETDFAIADRAGEVAKRRGISRMQIALAWVLSRPGVTAPIVGASKLPHLDEAIDALDVKLTAEECAYLEELYQPHAVVGPL